MTASDTIFARMKFLSGSDVPQKLRTVVTSRIATGADPKRVEKVLRRSIVKLFGVHHRVQANRETGTETMVCNARDYEEDLTAGKYMTICCTHSTLVQQETLVGAKACASYPTNFCDDCRAIKAGAQ